MSSRRATLIILSMISSFVGVVPATLSELPTECIFQDGTRGTCSNVCENSTIPPAGLQVCYYVGDVAYTCCKSTTTFVVSDIEERKSVRACRGSIRYHIVHGDQTQAREFPFMAALGWRSPILPNTYNYRCGGALIWRNFVLTAAHCALQNGLAPDVVLLGGVELSDVNQTLHRVKQVFIHPDYNANYVYNDIALLELDEYINDNVACLWTQTNWDDNGLIAIGYGDTSFGGARSNSLLKAKFNIVPNDICRRQYETDEVMPLGIVESQLCARDPNMRSDTCQGDSGGPLIVYKNNYFARKAQIVGITSYGKGCALAAPGVYTRISAYLDWIESIVWPYDCCF